MKSDPWRHQLASYPYTFDIVTRFGDVDRNDHLNNVAIAQLYEELRVRFAHHARESGSQSIATWTKMVVGEVRISYLREMHYPGIVTGGIGIQRIGNASYQLGCALFQNGQCASVAEVVLVCISEGRSAPIPEAVRARLNDWLIKLPT